MIGLGVGIDYALFVVTRFRQELAAGRGPRPAVVVTLATAGRAVLFAGSTVVISLLGLFLIGQPYMIGVATVSIVAVLFVMLAALTLLPALLGFAGPAIDRLGVPFLRHRGLPAGRGFWFRWSRTVQRRAWLTGVAAVVVLSAGRADVLDAPGVHRRRQQPDVAHDPAGLRPLGRGVRARVQRSAGRRGGHGRAVVGAGRRSAGRGAPPTPGVAEVAPPRFDGSRPRGGRHRRSRRRRPRRRPPSSWSTGCGRTSSPASSAAPASSPRSAGRRRPGSTRRRSCPAGCTGSSVRSSSWPSCC